MTPSSGNQLGWEPEYDPHVITEAATKSCLYLLLSSISSRYRKILASRGHDPNLIQILPGYARSCSISLHLTVGCCRYGQTGAQLCASPLVDKILFIGSPATGKKVSLKQTVEDLILQSKFFFERSHPPTTIFPFLALPSSLTPQTLTFSSVLSLNSLNCIRIFAHTLFFWRKHLSR